MTKAIRWSDDELNAHLARRAKPAPAAPAAKPNKYAAQKVEQDGVKFDSKKEARRWAELEARAAAGEIRDLRRQVAFVLAPAVRLDGEKRMKPALRYFADAVYVEHGVTVIEDTKSAPTRKTPIFRAKKHLMATVLGLQIKEV